MDTIYYSAPCGTLRLISHQGKLTSCLWVADTTSTSDGTTDVLEEACRWLDCYFSKRPLPPLPPLDHGSASAFTLRVREALMQIPYGSTQTYSRISSAVGNPNASRAVGSVCARNPFHVFIPCHRVLPASGNLGNYAAGADIKNFLLKHEGEKF